MNWRHKKLHGMDQLVANLPYDETKNYLKKVNSRIALYKW